MKTQPITIALMQALANRRGGRCLTETYVNGRSKLIWQCEKGHIWQAQPRQIEQGRWCPMCARVAQRGWKNRG